MMNHTYACEAKHVYKMTLIITVAAIREFPVGRCTSAAEEVEVITLITEIPVRVKKFVLSRSRTFVRYKKERTTAVSQTLVYVHGKRAWYTCMVYVHGIRAWYTCMVYVHGIRAWYTCMVYVHGTRAWYTCMVYVHGIRAWYTCMAFVYNSVNFVLSAKSTKSTKSNRSRITVDDLNLFMQEFIMVEFICMKDWVAASDILGHRDYCRWHSVWVVKRGSWVSVHSSQCNLSMSECSSFKTTESQLHHHQPHFVSKIISSHCSYKLKILSKWAAV